MATVQTTKIEIDECCPDFLHYISSVAQDGSKIITSDLSGRLVYIYRSPAGNVITHTTLIVESGDYIKFCPFCGTPVHYMEQLHG